MNHLGSKSSKQLVKYINIVPLIRKRKAKYELGGGIFQVDP